MMERSPGLQDRTPPEDRWPKVAVIILNWNGWRDTIECLESLQRVIYPNYQVIIVDNGSTDDSLEKIKAWAKRELPTSSKYVRYEPSGKPIDLVFYDHCEAEKGDILEEESTTTLHQRLIVIQSGANLGFAEGNNVGIRYALASRVGFEYICLLNNDTVVEPDFLTYLVQCAEEDHEIGIVGGKVLFYDDPSRIWYGGGYVSLWGRGPGYVSEYCGRKNSECPQYPRSVTFVTGCLMLVRRNVFNECGLLDPYMFFGGEDADFCLRALRKGFKIKYEPNAVIYHKAARTYNPRSQEHIYYVYRGKCAFVKKHLPKLAWWMWLSAFAVYLVTFAPARSLLKTKCLQSAINTIVGGIRAIVDVIKFNQHP